MARMILRSPMDIPPPPKPIRYVQGYFEDYTDRSLPEQDPIKTEDPVSNAFIKLLEDYDYWKSHKNLKYENGFDELFHWDKVVKEDVTKIIDLITEHVKKDLHKNILE